MLIGSRRRFLVFDFYIEEYKCLIKNKGEEFLFFIL